MEGRMGKKKHKHGKQDRSTSAGMPLAGLFAAAASPAGKQVIAGVLRKAADALDRRAPAPPRAPEAPVPPSVAANDVPPSPRGEVPPEVAKVIGSIAAGLERWAGKR
jgi:hypothetical protein